MRLIDADKLESSLNETVDAAIKRHEDCLGEIMQNRSEAAIMAFGECILRLKEQPTVDAVEVVRCKNCRHWVGEYLYQNYGRNYKKCEATPYLRTEESHFCAMGERREADGGAD